MKRLMAPVFVAVVCVATAVLAAENVAGTWKWTTSFGGKTRESTLKLKQDGEKLSGAYIGGQGNTETPIEGAKLDGDTISFNVTRERDGQKFTTKYSGKVAGDTITGKSERQRDGQAQSSEWVAKRQK